MAQIVVGFDPLTSGLSWRDKIVKPRERYFRSSVDICFGGKCAREGRYRRRDAHKRKLKEIVTARVDVNKPAVFKILKV